MIDSSRCPPEKTVVDYAAGRLSGTELTAVQQHLAECGNCREAMEWVQFHFFMHDTNHEEDEVTETRSLLNSGERDASVPTCRIAPDRFDMGLLLPSTHPNALGRLGNYDVLELIGFGGMGVVFKAYDDRLRRTVAIKALNRSLSCSSTARRRFIREARAAAAINHPNVVTIYSVEEYHDQPFLVMEHIGGSSLRDRLRKEGQLDPIAAIRIAAQIGEGLEAAHRQGIIHRDVKPANIMLEDGLERVKIADFGLARAAVDSVELTSREMAVGTPAYMAPEQVRGDNFDTRADLFAFGCVMYAMLVGHSPFHGKSSLEMARKVSEEMPPSPSQVNSRTPAFLSEIIMRLLEKNPEDRFQTAGEVAEILSSHLAVLNQTPTDELSRVLYGRPLRRRSRWWMAVPAGLLLLLLLLLTVVGRVIYVRDGTDATGEKSTAAKSLSMVASRSEPLPNAKLTVAQNAAADFSSVTEALERAGPGAEIQILDDGTYEVQIQLNRADRWAGLRITGQGPRKPTFVSDSAAIAVVEDTPDVLISGVRFLVRSSRQHAVVVRGNSPGLTLQNLDVAVENASQFAMVHVTASARGNEHKPIRIIDSHFQSTNMAVVVDGDPVVPVSHVHITGNTFEQSKTHVQFNRSVQFVQATGNVFNGGIGVALGLVVPETTHHVVVANNTFVGCEQWLDLRLSSPEVPDVVIANNLILQPQSVSWSTRKYSVSEYAAHWTFRSNVWELAPGGAASDLSLISELRTPIEVLSRDPQDSSRYLRPSADSPLAKGGMGQGLPEFVGAFPPVSP